ncbi:ATP-binding cassette domain-containing protein [Pseudomonas orientalis]|uniref:ABC-type multidrug transport system, ATPase and permease component n=1 Tax=Pseudomonas orientalis TaxID=76758 RepID=A0A1H2E719_9PSED|nr:ATP-binding cassette domain-containing protein [Pseudomonas orientalis]KRP66821.1 multidrug ABC transporter permease [Pseudomonas orientalis]SDT90962.1 ABC-type multidrug transport system, ATPase and permease component [Pseudomonas orientalis]
MKIAEILKTILWFRTPEPERNRGADSVHASRWQRWCKAVVHDARGAGKGRLHIRIFAALKRDVMLALVAIGVHTAAAFGAAIYLKSLLAQLMQDDSPVLSNITQGATCLALTYCAWLALNHTFFLAELVGVGSRSYVEQRILLKRTAAQSGTFPLSLTTLFDREAARVESSWSGLITITLALATVIFTSTFFFFALGVSAMAALAVIVGSSLTVFWIAQRLNMTYEQLSLSSTQRIEIGAFATKNRRQACLKNWNAELIRDYASKRNLEEASLKKAARLVAAISLISTMTPIAALLSSALLQLFYLGHVDAPGVLAAIALIGGLRSVANNIPDIVQSISQGIVGHQHIEQYLDGREPSTLPPEMPTMPSTTAKHIAIVGAAGSGKTSVLRNCAQRFPEAVGQAIFIPDEPWIFAGGLGENLSLYRRDFSDEEVRNAVALARLPEQFYLDYINERNHGAKTHWDVSRGQGKRFELVRALLAQPEWIYIDQPTSGLDETLAAGLLTSLLQGPWRDTRVMFVTDKPEEKDAAEEVWTVSEGRVTDVKIHYAAARFRRAAAPVVRPVPVRSAPEADRSTADDPAKYSRSMTSSLMGFGIGTITLIAFIVLALKEVLTIAGDYLIASGYLSTHLHASLIGLASVLLVSALLSISGALMTVRKSIEAASAQCIRYFSYLMNPGLDKHLTQEINRDSQNKLTWDQRRVDEVLPVLLLETVSAATLLFVTTGYVVLNNIYVVFPFILIGLFYWRGARRSGELLQRYNTREIDATAVLFSRVQALNWDGGRFDSTANNSSILDWLSASLATRAFASLDNAATRRWYSYKLDLMGVFFLVGIVASTIYFHATGTGTMANVLAVSLSYSLIAIFARLGRCAVELRQVLDSADRLVVAGTFPATAPRRQQARENAPLVAFSNVTFVNPCSGTTVLEQFDQAFHENDVVVIMGASGVGKSTFANLVVGSLLPSLGKISTLGGTDGYLARQHAEEVQLLTSSPIFKPGLLIEHFNSPSREELYQRAAYLGLSDIVERLPDGFNQQVPWSGEINLSKSELQRLALLDLTINTPAIAILDEATSELSSAEELQLIKKVITALPQTLFFIITHNPELSTLGNRNFNFNHEKRMVEKTE